MLTRCAERGAPSLLWASRNNGPPCGAVCHATHTSLPRAVTEGPLTGQAGIIQW